ncbi:sigma-like protein [Streptomyces pimonensis]|uniref:Sigma-like protein n=1 Tax=Streptomyces pimonensis TaxID=2860288 RepID=A0ABV4IRI4_9ACTN
MSETTNAEGFTTQDQHSPAPSATDAEITALDQHSPAPPARDPEITTLDQHSPAPPALNLDGR